MEYPQDVKYMFFDIEIFPIRGLAWQAYDTNLLDVEDPVRILSISYAINNSKVICLSGDERKILGKFLKALEDVDVLVAYNGDAFDIRIVNTRLVQVGLGIIPTRIKSIDLLKFVKKYFRLEYNNMDYVARFLGLPGKIKLELSVWLKAMRGDRTALEKIQYYNMHDVRVLRSIFEFFYSKYADTKIGILNHLSRKRKVDTISTEDKCQNCSSLNIIHHGYSLTKKGAKRRLLCKACNTNFSRSLTETEKQEFEQLWKMK